VAGGVTGVDAEKNLISMSRCPLCEVTISDDTSRLCVDTDDSAEEGGEDVADGGRRSDAGGEGSLQLRRSTSSEWPEKRSVVGDRSENSSDDGGVRNGE